MGDTLLEVDGAILTKFAGGAANFQTYRGAAFQINDELGRYVALTPAQALRIAYVIKQDLQPTPEDDGGHAFPVAPDSSDGLTALDAFAAAALGAVKASGYFHPDLIADQCYRLAAAFVKARKAVHA